VSQVAVRTLAAVPSASGKECAAAGPPVTARSATSITLTWLVRLRWGFFVAQAATIAGARYVLDVHEKLDIEALARWVVHPSAGEAFMRLHES